MYRKEVKVFFFIFFFIAFSTPHFMCHCDHAHHDESNHTDVSWSQIEAQQHQTSAPESNSSQNSSCPHHAQCFSKLSLNYTSQLGALNATLVSLLPAIALKSHLSEAHLRPLFHPPAFLNV